MLTLPSEQLIRDERPAYRPWSVEVSEVRDLGPTFRRVRFAAPGLAGFGTGRRDQRVKLLIPDSRGRVCDVGEDDADCLAQGGWYRRWSAVPAGERNPFRTYTVRAVRPELGELDVDFVLHEPAGPAGRWLGTVRPGDRATIVGPDARSLHSDVGIDWRPGEARELLLAGDETAVPAVLAILESLPAGARATAFLSVPHAADEQPVRSAAEVTTVWLARDRGAASLPEAVAAWADSHRQLLQVTTTPQALEDVDVDRALLWDSPDRGIGSFYAWFAGEAAVIKELRRLLVRDFGVERRCVAFMGYWRRGRAEAQE
ncbi:MAG: siderophore-interacting protein [Micrococcales bacterium]|nr:siderophore-interacting protein [Micrococcales bacterium]